jgi:hypothetical protein
VILYHRSLSRAPMKGDSMNVKELIEQLSKFPDDMQVCCGANGYDSTSCPSVEEVKIETMILLDGDLHPSDYFPKENIKDDPKYKVVLLG